MCGELMSRSSGWVASIAEGTNFGSQSSPPQSGTSFPPAGGGAGIRATLAIVSAVLSLIIVPEIFGPIAIILGADTWKKEQGNRGLYLVIIGIICMLIGLYFTSIFELGDLLPSLSSNTASAMNAALGIFA
jgi:hypothetical protein